jgi:protein transport protein SEC24
MSQLVLPDRMQLLPLFVMCMFKSSILRSGIPERVAGTSTVRMTPSGDERAQSIYYMSNAQPATSLMMVNPLVLSVIEAYESEAGDGDWVPSQVDLRFGCVQLPRPTPASVESLRDDGVYLVDNGIRVYLYLGRLVPPETRDALLRVSRSGGTHDASPPIRQLLDRLLWQLHVNVSAVHGADSDIRPTAPPLVYILQQEEHKGLMEQDVLNLMVEDAMASEPDYVDFLCTVHRRVRERIPAK